MYTLNTKTLERSHSLDAYQNSYLPVWEQTMQLRVLKKGKTRTIQQMWVDRANGVTEWRDIPEVEEPVS